MPARRFSTIELLVTLAVVGVFLVVGVVTINSSRAKARDAKRLLDVKQVQMVLELFYMDHNAYPTGKGVVLGGDSAHALCDTGWSGTPCTGIAYMSNIPTDPQGGLSTKQYVYSQSDDAASQYTITFDTEGAIGSISSGGSHTATAGGIATR